VASLGDDVSALITTRLTWQRHRSGGVILAHGPGTLLKSQLFWWEEKRFPCLLTSYTLYAGTSGPYGRWSRCRACGPFRWRSRGGCGRGAGSQRAVGIDAPVPWFGQPERMGNFISPWFVSRLRKPFTFTSVPWQKRQESALVSSSGACRVVRILSNFWMLFTESARFR